MCSLHWLVILWKFVLIKNVNYYGLYIGCCIAVKIYPEAVFLHIRFFCKSHIAYKISNILLALNKALLIHSMDLPCNPKLAPTHLASALQQAFLKFCNHPLFCQLPKTRHIGDCQRNEKIDSSLALLKITNYHTLHVKVLLLVYIVRGLDRFLCYGDISEIIILMF